VSGRRRHLWRDRSGGSLIEFAIAAPLLILVLAGIAQYCWVQHCASSLRYALSVSSRSLMLSPNMTQEAFVTLVKSKLTAADPNVAVSLSVASVNGRKVATATGTYDHSIPLIVAPSIPLHYRTTVVTSLPSV